MSRRTGAVSASDVIGGVAPRCEDGVRDVASRTTLREVCRCAREVARECATELSRHVAYYMCKIMCLAWGCMMCLKITKRLTGISDVLHR